MKLRIISLLLVFCMAVSWTGCSQKSSGGGEDAGSTVEKEDPEALLKEAKKNFDKEELKSMESSVVTTYDDGMEDQEDCTYIYDKKAQVIESISQDEDGVETYLHSFNVKEKDGYKVYAIDSYNDGDWVVYEEELEKGEQSEYEYLQESFSLDIDEKHGYSDIEYSNEGEDVINDVDAIKLKVSAKEEYGSDELESSEITRQSVMDEYGWTEEEIAVVDGFSDVLDKYVAASNQQGGDQKIQTVFTVWIGADNHQLLRVRSEQNMESGKDEGAEEMRQSFENERWKMEMVHGLVSEDGKSTEEAKKELEKEIQKMENPQDVEAEETAEDSGSDASGDGSGESGTEFYSSVLKVVTTKRFKTGERCPQMGTIPENAREVTQEEYYQEGFESYQQYYEEQEQGEELEDSIQEYEDLGDLVE